jgi:hypothetical protein
LSGNDEDVDDEQTAWGFSAKSTAGSLFDPKRSCLQPVCEGHQKTDLENFWIRSCYPIITQLRDQEKAGREFARELMNQNRRHGRRCSLFSIDTQFPKLDVAGPIQPL